MEQDIRWQQRFHNYTKALSRFQEAVDLAKSRELSQLEKQGLIQSFEFTQELSWKVMKDFLEYQGVATGIMGSKDAIRNGFSVGLIQEGDIWMDMVTSRNSASHTYNEETADAILQKCIHSYIAQFCKLRERLEMELSSAQGI